MNADNPIESFFGRATFQCDGNALHDFSGVRANK